MTSETFAVDRRYLVLQYSVASIAYLQQVLGMKDFLNLNKLHSSYILFYWETMLKVEVG